MLKNILRTAFQKMIGFERYLFIFSLINIVRIRYLRQDPEFLFFLDTVKKEGAILDIGANIGFTTVLLAQKFPLVTVYAFEPIQANIHALKRTMQYYQLKNIVVIATALGNEEGEVSMQIPVINKAKMQGLAHVIENHIHESTNQSISVPIQKLDHLEVLQKLPAIAAIKIDVENFEYFVLQGGKALIAKHRPFIFCELWNNERRLLCFGLMQELGYQIKICRKNKLIDFDNQAALNFFFVPK